MRTISAITSPIALMGQTNFTAVSSYVFCCFVVSFVVVVVVVSSILLLLLAIS